MNTKPNFKRLPKYYSNLYAPEAILKFLKEDNKSVGQVYLPISDQDTEIIIRNAHTNSFKYAILRDLVSTASMRRFVQSINTQ